MTNRRDPDQAPLSAVSDLGLHCLHRPICPNSRAKVLFLICVRFVCISDEKRLYNLMNISLFFSLSGFPPQFHVTLPLRACGFFIPGKGNVTL